MKMATLKTIRNAFIGISLGAGAVAVLAATFPIHPMQSVDAPYPTFEVIHRITLDGMENRDVARIRYGDGVECVIVLPNGGVHCW